MFLLFTTGAYASEIVLKSGQKVEGKVSLHTASSTAFPQPAPGSAPHAGPMVVPAGKLKNVLGITEVKYIGRRSHLAITDSSLDEA